MITIETVANAVHTGWKVAHKPGKDRQQMKHEWRTVENELDGMWQLTLWADGDDELLDDIRTLREIANRHWVNS